MTKVTGSLKTILGKPALVTGVKIRPSGARVIPTGVMVDTSEVVEYSPLTGLVSFDAEPGEAHLVLMVGGRPETVGMVIPDKPTATLREVVESATVYPPAVVSAGVTAIRDAHAEALVEIASARASALDAVNTAVTTAVAEQMATKADKTTVEQLTGLVMGALGTASTALRRTKTL